LKEYYSIFAKMERSNRESRVSEQGRRPKQLKVISGDHLVRSGAAEGYAWKKNPRLETEGCGTVSPNQLY